MPFSLFMKSTTPLYFLAQKYNLWVAMKTVNEVSKLTGVSIRTLQYLSSRLNFLN